MLLWIWKKIQKVKLNSLRGWFGLEAPTKIKRIRIWHLRKCHIDFPETIDIVCMKSHQKEPLVHELMGYSFFIYLNIQYVTVGYRSSETQGCSNFRKPSARRLRQPPADPSSCVEWGHPKPRFAPDSLPALSTVYLLKSILSSHSDFIHSSNCLTTLLCLPVCLSFLCRRMWVDGVWLLLLLKRWSSL